MVEDPSRITQESSRILAFLDAMSFADCCPLSREFGGLPKRPGIYAIKHQVRGILYIGKSTNIQMRLRGGHKALGWAFIDRMDPDDVRVASVTVAYPLNRLLLQIERRMIARTHPPYNDRIALEE